MEATLWIVMPIIVVLITAWIWWSSNRNTRLLRGMRVTPIGSLREGEVVRIQGVLRYIAGPPLLTPVGNRRCVGYSIVATTRSDDSTETLVDENEALDFLVQDDTGTARVELTKYDLELEMDYDFDAGFLSEPSPRVLEFLQSRGKSLRGTFGLTRAVWITEGALTHGEHVSVIGRVKFEQAEDAVAGPYRGQKQRAVLVAPGSAPMVVTDKSVITGKQRAVRLH